MMGTKSVYGEIKENTHLTTEHEIEIKALKETVVRTDNNVQAIVDYYIHNGRLVKNGGDVPSVVK